jgi:hypothetical protein
MIRSSSSSWVALQAKAGNLHQLLHQLLQQQLQHSASTVPQLPRLLLQALLVTKLYMRCHTSRAGGSGQLQHLQDGAAADMISSSRSSGLLGAAGMQTCKSSSNHLRSFHSTSGQVGCKETFSIQTAGSIDGSQQLH